MSDQFWTAARVAELRELVAAGWNFKDIGARWGVSKSVALGKAWRLHLIGPNSVGGVPKIPTTIERLDALDKFPSRGNCVFPIGHPGEGEFHFCGEGIAAPGVPYCAPHMTRCYRAAGVNEP